MLNDDHIFKQRTLLKIFSPPKVSIFVQELSILAGKPKVICNRKKKKRSNLEAEAQAFACKKYGQLSTSYIQDLLQILTAQTLQFVYKHLNWENQPFNLEAHTENWLAWQVNCNSAISSKECVLFARAPLRLHWSNVAEFKIYSSVSEINANFNRVID